MSNGRPLHLYSISLFKWLATATKYKRLYFATLRGLGGEFKPPLTSVFLSTFVLKVCSYMLAAK